ncbi:MAG: DNA repair protein RecO [Phycisphaerales bacterium]|nr:DNA repair protein RecO [Phycisphaerales bacterium]
MALSRDTCICLRKFEYSETSQILTLLGREHGIVRVMAKGAHRRTKAGASKFDGGIDLLDRGQAVFTFDPARDLQTLTEWHLDEGHLELRRNLRAVYLGQYAAELLSLLLENFDPHPALFDRLEQMLPALATSQREEVFLAFELELLRQTGHLPQLGDCANCARPINSSATAYFSPSTGGAICRDCEMIIHDRLAIDARLLRLLITLLRLPHHGSMTQRLPRLTRHQTDPLNGLLAQYLQFTLGRGLRLMRYVIPSPIRRVPVAT